MRPVTATQSQNRAARAPENTFSYNLQLQSYKTLVSLLTLAEIRACGDTVGAVGRITEPARWEVGRRFS